MGSSRNPALYQINTRILLGELSARLGIHATLEDISDSLLDWIAGAGFEWVWFLGVWQTGETSRAVSRSNAAWRAEFEATLPDLTEDDICGSPFAISAYSVRPEFGGNGALLNLRRRLADRGLKLMLDFVPNHMGLDHPWVVEHPEFFVHGDDGLLEREPQNYRSVDTPHGRLVLAYGRDPYFDGWPDTFQLNYRHRGLRDAMTGELARIAEVADGVRCDMAMLLLPDVFQRTWGERSTPADGSEPVDEPFWPAAVAAIRRHRPEFVLMAEVYWDLEYVLQQQGFDYTYDKRLYDRLHEKNATEVRGHLMADADFQHRSARFLENHDEKRAAGAFEPAVHEAAAIVTFLVPGLRFFHEGQFEGRRARVSMHLGRRPAEPVDTALNGFYTRLLDCLRHRAEVLDGSWRLLECRPAWDGNATSAQFVAFSWEGQSGHRLLVVVNYGPSAGQCYASVVFAGLAGKSVELRDLMSTAAYTRDGDELASRGLYLDMPAWGYHVFAVTTEPV